MDNILTETVDNGLIENVHLAPIGDFKGSSADGQSIAEHITVESLQRIADDLNHNNEEVLMDIDHASTRAGNKKNTEAVGWFHKFVVDPIKGLFANLKLTKRGKELIENREYRFVSPTFALNENGEPALLHSVAATNLPAFKGHIKPILNTESEEILTNNNNEDNILAMNKEDLVNLIKETILSLNTCSSDNKEEEVKNEEVVEETKKEEVEEKTETVEEPKEEVVEDKVEEEVIEEKTETVEEKKEGIVVEEKIEEPKEEVIKLEVLNSSPTPTLKKNEEWKHLHGKAFFDYIAKHPEVYNQ